MTTRPFNDAVPVQAWVAAAAEGALLESIAV